MGKKKGSEFSVPKLGLYWPDKRTVVDKTILPFQVVEVVNVPKAEREREPLFYPAFGGTAKEKPEWRNKLIWGDNKWIMSSLLPEFAGKIDLIYIDPPFATGADFSYKVRVEGEEWVKEASVIEERAYRDTWGKGLDSYLQMMYDRLVLMRELLSDTGSIYVHLDSHVGHYMKVALDEIFGKDNFQREIVWDITVLSGFKTQAKNWIRGHDMILFYTKNAQFTFNKVTVPHREEYIRRFNKVDDEGRKYFDGRGGKRYLDEVVQKGKPVGDVWSDVMSFQQIPTAAERVDFPTQKPESLLDRIIKASSNEGDLVADFFCGSGTTGAVAEKLGRRWIMADLSKFAIHTTRKRLLDIPGCKPFEVLNLGNYQKAKLAENGIGKYVDFILKLYRAEKVQGYTTLHGKKGRRMVHIGAVDSVITEAEVRDVLKECAASGVGQVDILGWDFEMGLHEIVDKLKEMVAESKVVPRLVQIPREVLEVRSPDKEEVKFFDLNHVDVESKVTGKSVTLKLKDFVISNPEYLPQEVRDKLSEANFDALVDYWAVDFDFKDDTFHNMWQSFRTRKKKELELTAHHDYEKKGKYKVLVKVVDIFGNDTNKLIEVEVK